MTLLEIDGLIENRKRKFYLNIKVELDYTSIITGLEPISVINGIMGIETFIRVSRLKLHKNQSGNKVDPTFDIRVQCVNVLISRSTYTAMYVTYFDEYMCHIHTCSSV